MWSRESSTGIPVKIISHWDNANQHNNLTKWILSLLQILWQRSYLGKTENLTNIIEQVTEEMGPAVWPWSLNSWPTRQWFFVILAMLPDCTYKYTSLPTAMLLGGMIAGERNEIPLHICSFMVSFVAPPNESRRLFPVPDDLTLWLAWPTGKWWNDNVLVLSLDFQSLLLISLDCLMEDETSGGRPGWVPRYVRLPKDLRSAKPPKSAYLQV